MNHDRYGLDGQPIYPRSGHFDHVTGQQLAVFMVIAGAALAYMANVFG